MTKNSYIIKLESKKIIIKEGDLIITQLREKSQVIIPKKQAWFWSKEWQQDEKQADKDIRNGKTKKFDSVQKLFEDLDTGIVQI